MKKKNDGRNYRILGIFYRILRGSHFNKRNMADVYGVDSKTVGRDIACINGFLANPENPIPIQNAKVEFSRKENSYVLKNGVFLENAEVFAIMKVLLGVRCFNEKDMKRIIQKFKTFTSAKDTQLLQIILDKEMYHYKGLQVHSDCDSVINNLWKLTSCIEEQKYISITYLKMDRSEVIKKVRPSSLMFSEYYFYLIAYDMDDSEKAKYFRVDRIRYIREHREHFRFDQKYDFNEGTLRQKNQYMFPGKNIKVTFEFTGPSVQAVLDRLPLAKVIEQRGNVSVIAAEVQDGRGLMIYLLSQGSWVKVLSPQSLIEDMKKEIDAMRQQYD